MDDRAVIEEYMRELAVRALADAIRARSGDLEIVDHERALINPLRDAVPAAVAPRVVTTRPRLTDADYELPGWWERHWPKVAAAVFAGGLAIGLFWLVTMAVSAVVATVATAIPSLLGLGVLALVVLLCLGRGSGGRAVSGTWQGRIH